MSRDDDTEDVIASIDGALTDWEVSADAMRWSPEPENATPSRDPSRLVMHRSDLMRDLLLYGHAYVEEGTGRRIDPMGVVMERQRDGTVRVGFDPGPGPFRAVPPPQTAVRFARVMQEVSAAMVPVIIRAVEVMDRLGAAARPAADPPDDLDPRERALRARRNRNTGPARDPFTHRGNR